MKLFRDFAGHEPRIEPLLERRGLVANAPASAPATAPPSGTQ
jgi:peptidyl-dipeptidase Dcp